MADPVFSANQQQRNGKTSSFSPYRRAGGGAGSGGGPLVMPPPTGQKEEVDVDYKWQRREPNRPDGSLRSGEDACPGEERATPPWALGGTQGLGAPEEAQSLAEGQNHDTAPDLHGEGDEEQLGLQENPQIPGYCRPQTGGEEEKQVGKKKHRRRPSKKKRHWKPYYKLTWEEKKKFDEKQSQRASRLRAEMFAKGQPVAPYNTTQFLMEDHDQEEPDLKTGLYPKRSATKSDDTSEEDFMEEEDGGSDGMGGDGSEFLQKDFSETYERFHVESLQNMSKQELITEYLELEKCLSRMEEENNRLRVENKKFAGESVEDPRIRKLEEELDWFRAENLKLLQEKELLRQEEKPLCKLGD